MARTRAQKLAEKRRGRPRKEGAREPSGRPTRSKQEPADKLAIETRVRHLGISADVAKNQKVSTFIGYLNVLGPRDGLSDQQYEAAEKYLELRARHLRSIKAPGAIYDSEAQGGTGDDPDAYADWCKRVGEEYRNVRTAIQEAQNYSRENLWAALDLVVIEGQHLHGMIGATRILCNVLARFFKCGVENSNAA